MTIKTNQVEIHFDSQAKVNKIIDSRNDCQLNQAHVGPGKFTVRIQSPNGTIREEVLDKLVRHEDHLLVANKNCRFSFKIEMQDRYVTIRMNDFSIDHMSELLSLSLTFNCTKKTRIIPLDYMVEYNGHGHQHTLAWPWLWGRNDKNPLGGFAIFFPKPSSDHKDSDTQSLLRSD